MNLEKYTKEELWTILIETVHANVMYPTHKSYTRENIIQENPSITPIELSMRLNMPRGEAMVIIDELHQETKSNQ